MSAPATQKHPGRLRALLPTLLVALLVVLGAHASDTATGARFDTLSHKLMCTCGCNQLLGECNHMGCPDLEQMSNQLTACIRKGDSDTQIFRLFQERYGATALAAPMFTGLNRFSWWVPPLALLFGLGIVFAVVRRWRPGTVAMPAPPADPHAHTLEQRIRHETGGDLP